MSNNDRQSAREKPLHPESSVEETALDSSAEAASRRRFLKFGVAAIPVIVTLRATPLHAETGQGSLGLYSYGGGGGGAAGGSVNRPGGDSSQTDESFGGKPKRPSSPSGF